MVVAPLLLEKLGEMVLAVKNSTAALHNLGCHTGKTQMQAAYGTYQLRSQLLCRGL
jgi:hypothetical protein